MESAFVLHSWRVGEGGFSDLGVHPWLISPHLGFTIGAILW